MKKLLSVLAAVGLTATASTAVVACTTTIKASKTTHAEGGVITTTKTMKLKALSDATDADGAFQSEKEGFAISFDKKGKDAKKDDKALDVTFAVKDTTSFKKGKSYDVTISFTLVDKVDDAGTAYLYRYKTDGTKTTKVSQIAKISWDAYKAPAPKN